MLSKSIFITVFLIFYVPFLSAVCFEGVSYESVAAHQEQRYGSTIEIIANKEKLDGKFFFLKGVLSVDNHNRIFLYRDLESLENLIFTEAFILDVSLDDVIKSFDGKYVSLEAIYYKEGFNPRFAGRFSNIVRICPNMSLADFNATRLK